MPPPEDWEVEHVRWQEEEVQPRNRCSLPEFWAHFDGGTGDASAGREWTPAPHVTPADTARDTKSLQRCLDQRLYFLVRLQGTNCGCPQGYHATTAKLVAKNLLASQARSGASRSGSIGWARAHAQPQSACWQRRPRAR